MSTKPTPGPWSIRYWGDHTYVDGCETVIADKRGHGIVSFLQKGKGPKVMANAKLIAAAPRMKKSIEDFLLITRRLSGCPDPECATRKENQRIIKEAELLLLEIEV